MSLKQKNRLKFMAACMAGGKSMEECSKEFDKQQTRVKFNQALIKLNCPTKVISSILHLAYEMEKDFQDPYKNQSQMSVGIRDQKEFPLHLVGASSNEPNVNTLTAQVVASDWWLSIMKDIDERLPGYNKDLAAITDCLLAEKELLQKLELAQRGVEQTVGRDSIPRAYTLGQIKTSREMLEMQIEPFRIKLEAFHEAEQTMGVLIGLTSTDHLTGALSPNIKEKPNVLKTDSRGNVKVDGNGYLHDIDWTPQQGIPTPTQRGNKSPGPIYH
jgi:hypothetical protein